LREWPVVGMIGSVGRLETLVMTGTMGHPGCFLVRVRKKT
jgi:hypothetical protein